MSGTLGVSVVVGVVHPFQRGSLERSFVRTALRSIPFASRCEGATENERPCLAVLYIEGEYVPQKETPFLFDPHVVRIVLNPSGEELCDALTSCKTKNIFPYLQGA